MPRHTAFERAKNIVSRSTSRFKKQKPLTKKQKAAVVAGGVGGALIAGDVINTAARPLARRIGSKFGVDSPRKTKLKLMALISTALAAQVGAGVAAGKATKKFVRRKK